jgi:hypothetical protein
MCSPNIKQMSRNNNGELSIDIDLQEHVDDQTLANILNTQYARADIDATCAALSAAGYSVWTNEQLLADFEVEMFEPPYVRVIRKQDGVRGTVAFIDSPRVYFYFKPSTNNDTEQPTETI